MPATLPVLSRDPEVHSGDLVFAGTRVPVATFVEHLKDGGSLGEFLEGYPTVARWQALGLLEQLASRPVEQALQVGPEAVRTGIPTTAGARHR
jgi:uncharacterized protein (DUF433 family)